MKLENLFLDLQPELYLAIPEKSSLSLMVSHSFFNNK
jgi:hypothetical protein